MFLNNLDKDTKNIDIWIIFLLFFLYFCQPKRNILYADYFIYRDFG